MSGLDATVVGAILTNPAALAVHRWWLALDALRVATDWVDNNPHSKRLRDGLDASRAHERYWANEVLRAVREAAAAQPELEGDRP